MTSWVFAFNANLFVNNNSTNVSTNINKSINVTLNLSIDKKEPIKIKQIKGLKNFDVIWQSQSQSSASEVTVVNWKTKTIEKVNLKIMLSLSAKKAWSYTIWPAILEVWNKEYKTNTVNIRISWAKIMLNNTQNYQSQQNTQPQQVHNLVWWVRTIQQNTSQPKIQDFEKETIKKGPLDDPNIYLIVGLLLFLLFISIISILDVNKQKWKEKENRNNEGNENIKEYKVDTNIEEQYVSESNIDFEKKTIEYPNLEDENFESKLDNIFREKLQQDFNILNIKTKTYDEILQETGNNDKIKEIINWLKLLKYSNLVTDREKILEMVRGI